MTGQHTLPCLHNLQSEGVDATFGVMFHCILQVLHDPLLPNDLLNPGLGIHVERVRIQRLNRPLSLCSLAAFPVECVPIRGGEPCRVVQGLSDMGLCPLYLRTSGWITYYVQADELGVLLWCCPPLRFSGYWNTGVASHVSNVQRQHLPVSYLQLLQGLGVIVYELAVVVEVLRVLLDAGLGLDGAL